MQLDNYGGYSTIQYNPANLADSRFKFNMNVLGLTAHLQNNFVQMEAPHSIYKFFQLSLDSNFGKQDFNYPFEEYYMKERLNGRDKFVYASASATMLGMQFSLKDKAGFSFGFSTKAYGSLNNFSENGIKTFLQDLDTTGPTKENQQRLIGEKMDMSKAGAGALAYQQLSLKYARVIKDKKHDFMKIGFGLDYNIGLFGSYFRTKEVSFDLVGIDTVNITNSELEIAYLNEDYLSDPTRRLNDYFGKSRLGRGFGVNFGFVYEYRENSKDFKYKMDRKNLEDHSVNKYKWKIAASLTDLGFVNFNKSGVARKITINPETTPVNWNDFDAVDKWKSLKEVDSFALDFFSDVDTSSEFTMFTPAVLNLAADYKLMDDLYLGVNYSQNLIRNNGKGVKTPNVLSITPRYERKWFTVAMPISASRYYNVVNVGAYVRAGLFYVGSDNLGGFLTAKKTNGFNFYTGFNWPIHHKRRLDADGDGVSDNFDKCPDLAGTKYTEGCPDADGDKVRDSDDLCPNEFGTKRTNGCPDEDEDGLAGADDLCPNAYGSKNQQGCPDSDGDGLHDGVDKCPNQAGEKRFDGCPEAYAENPKKDDINETEPKVEKPKKEEPKDTKIIVKSPPTTDSSKFENWNFASYEYWPVLGAYNDIRWAQELQLRLKNKLNVTVGIETIPGVSKYYVTLGKAKSIAEAQEIQKILDIPAVNNELNGSLWWKKVVK